MRKLLTGGLLVLLLTGTVVFAAEEPPRVPERPRVPVNGTEGPDIRATHAAASPQPVKGAEGLGVR